MTSSRTANGTQGSLLMIGELAERAGVTVRTLQYYDRIGLLTATSSAGGRRMYGRDDLLRLQQILFFKSLGFPLDEIRNHLIGRSYDNNLVDEFVRQRDILAEQVERLSNVVKQLDTVVVELRSGREMTFQRILAILHLMKEGNPYDFAIRYIGDGQLAEIAGRFGSNEAAQHITERISDLTSEAQSLYLAAANPGGPDAQDLARRWWDIVRDFTGGDEGLLAALMSAGMDVDNWPDHTANTREVVKNFVGPALEVYLRQIGFKLPEVEEQEHD
ncbi:MerR family transcriptional regulator [Alicyclobacillus sp. ALC3]|uniref:MerR family transcriptional regulator n=1 Tax=Alicyclobacillus sp. ALC3 TaxID=2796143 RepID=UPI0023791C0D|nr:MerR family transcriptional regulator [Alicyclobacillus sp. ALC3]WDL96011.1 MerR family transcriptional regulator [Alicyclobacillus sp. ALC3]